MAGEQPAARSTLAMTSMLTKLVIHWTSGFCALTACHSCHVSAGDGLDSGMESRMEAGPGAAGSSSLRLDWRVQAACNSETSRLQVYCITTGYSSSLKL